MQIGGIGQMARANPENGFMPASKLRTIPFRPIGDKRSGMTKGRALFHGTKRLRWATWFAWRWHCKTVFSSSGVSVANQLIQHRAYWTKLCALALKQCSCQSSAAIIWLLDFKQQGIDYANEQGFNNPIQLDKASTRLFHKCTNCRAGILFNWKNLN